MGKVVLVAPRASRFKAAVALSAGLGATPQGALGGAAWLLRAPVWLALGAPSCIGSAVVSQAAEHVANHLDDAHNEHDDDYRQDHYVVLVALVAVLQGQGTQATGTN